MIRSKNYILLKTVIDRRFVEAHIIPISELKHEVFDIAVPCS